MIRYISKKLELKTHPDVLANFRITNIQKRFTLRVIIVLMLINILISIAILNQQTKIDIFFNNYYNDIHYTYDEKNLLDTLNAFRRFDKQIKQNKESNFKSKYIRNQNRLLLFKNFQQDQYESSFETDNIFKKNLLTDVRMNGYKLKKFYQPKILIDDKEKCSSKNNGKVFLICFIHSHKNNYIRRKAMRDTWLTLDKISLFEMININQTLDTSLKNNFNLEIVHFFVIGNDDKNETYEHIKHEANTFNDILMIDTFDDYKKLLYKHLTIINWIVDNCPNASYVLKLDDDVFVNIKSLSKHLINKFGLEPKHDSKFMYCNINELAKPMRNNNSKWYVDFDTYPFSWYPKYCEGFAYITNIATIRLMFQQSKIIPRFWIDDVYMTGLLLYGFDDVKWFNFKNFLKWSYYDFWDLGNTLKIYEIYAKLLSFFNINAIDFYLSDYFVILHSQLTNKEVNYNSVNISQNYLILNLLDKNRNQTESVLNVSSCVDSFNYGFMNQLNLINCTNLTNNSNQYMNADKNVERFFMKNFYDFCIKLWQKRYR